MEIKRETQDVKLKFQPKGRRLVGSYMKSVDINKFENYETMISSLRKKNQQSSERA